MNPKSLAQLLASLPAGSIKQAPVNPDIKITGLALDSREVKPGYLFFAISGAETNGEKYIAAAIQAGAMAICVSQDFQTKIEIPVIKTQDVRLTSSLLAAAFYDYPSEKIRTVGITGTNGKTSTAWIMANALAEVEGGAGLLGTLGALSLGKDIQLPATPNTTPSPLVTQEFFASLYEHGINSAICEVSSQGIAQQRVVGIEWDIGIFTNISRDHLDLHGTFENYAAIKRSYLEKDLPQCKKQAVAIINQDDKLGAALLAEIPKSKLKTYSFSATSKETDIYLQAADLQTNGSHLKISAFGNSIEFTTQLIGAYNVENILAAIAGLSVLGLSENDIANAMHKIPCVPGRMDLISNQHKTLVVDYAHTPDALVSVQKSLRELNLKGKLITVFGCGGDRDQGKRPLMGQAVAEHSDYFIITSDNPRSEDPEAILNDIIAGIKEYDTPWQRISDRETAIKQAIELATADDVVLIAGKGHEDYQEIKGVQHPFDDRQISRKILETL